MIGVFGSSGFIGRNLVYYFNQVDKPVRLFSRRALPECQNEFIKADLNDVDSYASHLKGISSVVLLVSASNPRTYSDNLEAEIEANVIPYARFMKVVSQSDVDRLVYISSGGAVYGTQLTDRIKESHPTQPVSPYGCAKLMIEEMIREESQRSTWDYTILRPANPIGRYQSTEKGQGLVSKAIEAGLTGSVLEVWGDGSAIRDYFNVNDLCRAIDLSIHTQCAENEIFNVGSGNGKSIKEIINIIENILQKNINIKYIEISRTGIDKNVLSSDKIANKLGFLAKDTLEAVINSVAHGG